jgi:hypothetical protein
MDKRSGSVPLSTNGVAFDFNRSVLVSGSEQRLSSDAGAMLLRQLDDRLGFTRELVPTLIDLRDPRFVSYTLDALLRERVYMLALGWKDQNDANRLRNDPALCVAVTDQRGPEAAETPLASQSTQSRLIDTLALRANRRTLRWATTDLAIRCRRLLGDKPLPSFTLDLDSTDKAIHGTQEGGKYNGHYGHTCYHPLLAFVGETGDLVGAWLRPGNVPSQKGAAAFATGLLERLEGTYGKVGVVRGDAAFAVPHFMNRLDSLDRRFTFRLKTNAVLDRLAEPYLKRPVGRPPNHVREWTYELSYKAGSWKAPRRVVLVVIDDPADRFLGEPALRYFFLVTNYTTAEKSGEELLAHYRERGTAEIWIGEFKNEVMPLLSSPRLVENAATFLLGAVAFQLAHLLRKIVTEVEARPERLSISGLRERVLKVAVRFTRGKRRLFAAVAASAFSAWSAVLAWFHRPRPLAVPR